MFGKGTTEPDMLNTDVDDDDKEMVKCGERVSVFVSIYVRVYLHSIVRTLTSHRR